MSLGGYGTCRIRAAFLPFSTLGFDVQNIRLGACPLATSSGGVGRAFVWLHGFRPGPARACWA